MPCSSWVVNWVERQLNSKIEGVVLFPTLVASTLSLWWLPASLCFLINLIPSLSSFCFLQKLLPHLVVVPAHYDSCGPPLRVPTFRAILNNHFHFLALINFFNPRPQASRVTLNSKNILNQQPVPSHSSWYSFFGALSSVLVLLHVSHIPVFFIRKFHDSYSSRVGQFLGYHPLFPETLLTPSLNKTSYFLLCSPTPLHHLCHSTYVVGETHSLNLGWHLDPPLISFGLISSSIE